MGRVRLVSTALLIGAAALLLALIAFGVPDPIMRVVAQVTGQPGLLPPPKLPTFRLGASRWAQDAGALPPETRAPIATDSVIGRLREIRGRAPLTIETTTLVVPPGTKILRIVAPSLTLRDATLVTNGVDVEIETERLDAANSLLLSYPPEAAVAAGKGGSGGHVRITVHGPVRGVLRVDLSGQAGAPGAPGAAGAAGKAGDVGAKARSALTECLKPAGRGGPGLAGGPGGAGGDGAAGGDGGILELVAADSEAATGAVNFTADAGAGGAAGPGGAGGAGGAGGLGGDPAGVCFGNGPAGPEGVRGATGAPGRAGMPGTPGRLEVRAGA